MRTSKQPRHRPIQQAYQRGSALIFCLVILTILTILGISSMSDINMQSAMTKNAQLRLQAYNTAYSEIEARLTDINVNFNRDVLLTAKDAGADGFEIETPDMFMPGDTNPFEQQMMMRLIEPNSGGGGAIVTASSEAAFDPLIYEIESQAWLEGTGTRSDQVQGITYLAPK